MADVTTNLELYLPLTSATLSGSTFSDQSGNARNGTSFNVPTMVNGPYGGVGGAMFFDGDASAPSGDSVVCGSAFIGAVDTTVTFWAYASSLGESSLAQPVTVSNSCWTFIQGGTNRFRFTSNSGTTQASAGNVIPLDGTWTHWAVTRTSAGVCNFYKNSVATGTANQSSGTPSAAVGNFVIGNDTSNGNRTWDGGICHVRVYSRVLALADIQQTMLDGSAPGGPSAFLAALSVLDHDDSYIGRRR